MFYFSLNFWYKHNYCRGNWNWFNEHSKHYEHPISIICVFRMTFKEKYKMNWICLRSELTKTESSLQNNSAVMHEWSGLRETITGRTLTRLREPATRRWRAHLHAAHVPRTRLYTLQPTFCSDDATCSWDIGRVLYGQLTHAHITMDCELFDIKELVIFMDVFEDSQSLTLTSRMVTPNDQYWHIRLWTRVFYE